ncbi:thiamine pyrophosphate-dependent enzyme [Floricoccus penangensis]|uniref:2-oxoisovalerate dehydrogenase subunit alpha n=1 Tax=Floricoccus penangensis TaxID=1859475 RepID=A0A9Q5JGZ8_9LACT|nr:thiamine pyrophosphate-dependent enzyme [Floricoccus penangensis]OFI47260.1 pyruvate dehydrogenase (acetyl-transferring) E1 component subunit alpha [Floricoccus penangensis]URZ87281.1 pyruvate dehydrogenase (acetyl-transferring) E1 component subunit alpha [Floricoccus penangensis]
MSKGTEILDFRKQLEDQENEFPTLQVLDNDGKLVDKELFEESGITDEDLVNIMQRMIKQFVLNERSTKLAKQGRLGFVAPTRGQEASQSATSYAFTDEDYLLPGYRDIPQMIHKGYPIYKNFLWSRGHYLGGEMDGVKTWFPQIIIGAQFVEAAGIALGMKMRKKNAVAYTYTGDGGSSQGDTYEGMNFAGAYKANAVFFIQNNGFAISTPRALQTAAPHIAAKGWGAGLPSIVVDGMDALACYISAKKARDWAASGNGPVLIETLCNRLEPHSMSGDDPLRYRTKEDIDENFKKDPLVRMRTFLEGRKLWSEEIEAAYAAEVNAEIDEAVKLADNAPKQKVSDFIATTLEQPGYVMQEQIKKFQEEGK